jgi:hypothetical protein
MNLFTGARVKNIVIFWVYAIFTNVRIRNIHKYCLLTQEQGT